MAKESGLVVMFGYSDDNVEIRGVFDDEVGAWNGATILFDKDGVFGGCSEGYECKYIKKAKEQCRSVKAVWHDEGNPCWSFETDIPHETFNIYEDGELFGVGIVFAADEVSP
jgi:hypothetical protein